MSGVHSQVTYRTAGNIGGQLNLAVGEATVKSKSVKSKCDLRVRVRAYYMYGTTAKFKSANIFISAARDQTAKFKDHQYFRLYGSTC